MPPVPLHQIGQLAEDLARAIAGSYADWLASDLEPEVRIHWGNVAPFDCDDTLWILHQGIAPFTGIGAVAGQGCAVLGEATLGLALARCWPAPDRQGAVDAAAEAQAAQGLAKDATILWWGITGRCYDGRLFTSYPDLQCSEITFGPLTPSNPQGARAGLLWQIRIATTARADDADQ